MERYTKIVVLLRANIEQVDRKKISLSLLYLFVPTLSDVRLAPVNKSFPS